MRDFTDRIIRKIDLANKDTLEEKMLTFFGGDFGFENFKQSLEKTIFNGFAKDEILLFDPNRDVSFFVNQNGEIETIMQGKIEGELDQSLFKRLTGEDLRLDDVNEITGDQILEKAGIDDLRLP